MDDEVGVFVPAGSAGLSMRNRWPTLVAVPTAARGAVGAFTALGGGRAEMVQRGLDVGIDHAG